MDAMVMKPDWTGPIVCRRIRTRRQCDEFRSRFLDSISLCDAGSVPNEANPMEQNSPRVKNKDNRPDNLSLEILRII